MFTRALRSGRVATPMKSPTKTSLRAFSPADYEDVIGVNRASYPDYRESLAEWRHWDDTWDAKKYFKARLVAEDGGRVVGWGQLNHAPWAFVSDKYRVDITVLPDFRRRGHGSALHDELVAIGRGRHASTLQAAARESHTDGVAFLARRGYQERKRDFESRLFVGKFDFSRFATADARVEHVRGARRSVVPLARLDRSAARGARPGNRDGAQAADGPVRSRPRRRAHQNLERPIQPAHARHKRGSRVRAAAGLDHVREGSVGSLVFARSCSPASVLAPKRGLAR